METKLIELSERINEDLFPLIDLLLKEEIDVYVTDWNHSKSITYIHFVKDNQIGYAQADRFSGITFSTVHKPCTSCGTGFRVGGTSYNADNIPIEQYEKAFHAPSWANSYTFQKYSSWDSFRSNYMHKTNNFLQLSKKDDGYYGSPV